MSEFSELYKKLSNPELLKIISESEKYKPIAIETAHLEIERRNLSEQELNAAKAYLQNKKEQKEAELKKRKQKEERLKKSAFTFLDTISPIQNGIQTPQKIIRFIIIIFGGIAIYRIYNQFYFFRYMFTDGLDKWDWSLSESIVPLVVLPIAIILFWIRKKIGWFLIAIFLTHSAISTIGLLIMNIDRRPSEITAFDTIFPVVPSFTFVLLILFYSTSLWLIYKSEVRLIFKILERPAFYTISLTAILNLIYVYFIINKFS
jgi:hypothetical protein